MSTQETERQYTERILREMLDEAKAAEDAEAEAARAAKAKAARAVAAKAEAVLARAIKPVLSRAGRLEPAKAIEPALPIVPSEAPDNMQASRESLIDGLFPVTEWPQPAKPQFPKLGRKASRRSDIVIAALGLTLGLICASFPWYIFFNQDQFGVQAIKFGGNGTNSGRAGGGVVAQGSAPLTAKDVPADDIDLLATGTVQSEPSQAPSPDEQPFPADTTFRMVHVVNGRAMIEDDAGVWIVQRGSTLPDSSQVSSIEQRGGRWVMVTSTDKVIELSD